MPSLIVDKLRKEIEMRDSSYRIAAKRIGVTHSTVRTFCVNKRYRPSLELIEKIAKAFGYEVTLKG